MARLAKLPPFTGTRDGICIYYMRGKFFIRSASSLTGERVKKDPAFSETRRHSSLLAKASRISSQVYSQLSGKHKTHELYNLLTGKAMKLLKDGIDENEIIQILSDWYAG